MQTHQIEWDISEKPIYSNNTVLANHKAIYRNDNNRLLNVVKKSYTPTTNKRFLEVVDCMQEITQFPIKDFAEFEGGRKVLAFLECTEPIYIAGFEFKDYMIIGNSHDSSTGFFIGNSSMMIRCSNRFSKIFRQLQIHHTKNHDVRIDEILRQFETYNTQRQALFSNMERMQRVEIDEAIKTALVEKLVKMNYEEKLGIDEVSTRKQNLIRQINDSILTECNELGDTAFGLLQGITNYTTHIRPNKSKVFGNVFGGVAQMNTEAFKFCEALL
jgi:hypothetical protein